MLGWQTCHDLSFWAGLGLVLFHLGYPLHLPMEEVQQSKVICVQQFHIWPTRFSSPSLQHPPKTIHWPQIGRPNVPPKHQTVNHHTVHKPKRKLSSDQQPAWKPGNFQDAIHLNSLQAVWSGNRILMGRDFAHPSILALGPTLPPIWWMLGLFLRGKAAGAWQWPSTHLVSRSKIKVKLHLQSPPGALWPVPAWTYFTFCKSIYCIFAWTFSVTSRLV